MLSEFLTQLRASCVARRIPLISPESEVILRKYLEENQPKTCLEIGAAVWYSSIVIASTIQKPIIGNIVSDAKSAIEKLYKRQLETKSLIIYTNYQG